MSSSVAMTNCAAAGDVGFVRAAIIITDGKKKNDLHLHSLQLSLTCFCCRGESQVDCKCTDLLWLLSLFCHASLWKFFPQNFNFLTESICINRNSPSHNSIKACVINHTQIQGANLYCTNINCKTPHFHYKKEKCYANMIHCILNSAL